MSDQSSNRRMRSRCTWAALLLLSGCGPGGPAKAPVSGQILVDGQPVQGLRVTFAPVGSDKSPYPGPGSYGETDQDGRYTLVSVKDKRRGAVVGPCRVRVRMASRAGPDVDPRQAARARQLPPRYNDETELTFEVPPDGTNAADFKLSWK